LKPRLPDLGGFADLFFDESLHFFSLGEFELVFQVLAILGAISVA